MTKTKPFKSAIAKKFKSAIAKKVAASVGTKAIAEKINLDPKLMSNELSLDNEQAKAISLIIAATAILIEDKSKIEETFLLSLYSSKILRDEQFQIFLWNYVNSLKSPEIILALCDQSVIKQDWDTIKQLLKLGKLSEESLLKITNLAMDEKFVDVVDLVLESLSLSEDTRIKIAKSAIEKGDLDTMKLLLESESLAESAQNKIIRWALENDPIFFNKVKSRLANSQAGFLNTVTTELVEVCKQIPAPKKPAVADKLVEVAKNATPAEIAEAAKAADVAKILKAHEAEKYTEALKVYEAAKDAQVNKVANLMARGVNLNAKDKHGNTALHYAAGNLENPDIVKILLSDRAVEVNVLNKANDNPMRMALKEGYKQAGAIGKDANSNLKMLESIGNANKIVSLLQEKGGAGYSLSKNNEFAGQSFKNALSNGAKKFLHSSAITWTIAVVFAIGSVALLFFLPFALPISFAIAALVGMAGKALTIAKSYYDAKNPIKDIITTGCESALSHHHKIDLTDKFLLGEYKVNSIGMVKAGDNYKKSLKKNESVYINHDTAYYCAADLPRNEDGSLKLSGNEQLKLYDRLSIAYSKAKIEADNEVLDWSNKKLGLMKVMADLQEAHSLIKLGRPLDGQLGEMMGKAFAKENVESFAKSIAASPKQSKMFDALYVRCKSGAVEVSLDTMFYMDQIRKQIIEPKQASIFEERSEPTVSTTKFFEVCQNHKFIHENKAILDLNHALQIHGALHAGSVDLLNKNHTLSLEKFISATGNLIEGLVKAAIAGAIGGAAAMAGKSTNEVIEGVSEFSGRAAGAINAVAHNYIAGKAGVEGAVAIAAGLVVADNLVNNYDQTKYALKYAASTAISGVSALYRPIKAVVKNLIKSSSAQSYSEKQQEQASIIDINNSIVSA